jgi:gas vesicle protein
MSNNRSSHQSSLFVGGLLLGAAIGAVAGLLSAPRSGRDTRQLLRKSADALPELAEDLSSSVQMQAGRLSESALRRWDETLVRLREAIAAGVEASQGEQRLNTIAADAKSPALNDPYSYKPESAPPFERRPRSVTDSMTQPRSDRDRPT